MINRINLILQAKNITAKQFAEEIGVQPSGMSHIMSGRNNPSLDFVMKVVKRYPEVNIYWLMFGKGEMYDTGNMPAPVITAESSNEKEKKPILQPESFDLFSSQGFSPMGERLEATVDKGTKEEKSKVSASKPVYRPLQGVQEQLSVAEEDDSGSPTPISSSAVKSGYTAPHSPQPVANQQAPVVSTASNMQTFPHENRSDESVQGNGAVRRKRIVKFIVLYDDHSFSEYYPEG